MTRALLGIGSNLGDRFEHLQGVISGLRDVLIAVSGVYESPSWGDTQAPPYLNAVALVAADITPRQWLRRGQAAERAAGRVRDRARRYAPRTLDVDVIAAWTDDGEPLLSSDAELTLPHPRAHLRAFVLKPWLDIDPDATLPGHGSVAELLASPAVAADLASVVERTDLSLAG